MDICFIGASNLPFLGGSKTGTDFPKKSVVTGKTPLFVIGSLCSCHSIYLNTGF